MDSLKTAVGFLLETIREIVALVGVLIITWGALKAAFQFVYHKHNHVKKISDTIEMIRLQFGRAIILGLEFIVAADVIETISAPDFYSLGILGSLVAIRTFLTYFMNREMIAIAKQQK